MEIIMIVGSFAGATSILGYLPQIIKSQKLKSMREFSSLLLMLFTLSSLLWMIYGFYKLDFVLGGLSSITFSMGLMLIIMKIIYEKKYLNWFAETREFKVKELNLKLR